MEEQMSLFKGLSIDTIHNISKYKKESDFMKNYRIDAYNQFLKSKEPSFGPDLSFIDYNSFTYFKTEAEHVSKSWEDVPVEIRNTFSKLGIQEAEAKYLSGVIGQYDSTAVYSNYDFEYQKKGVIFKDTDTALKEHPEIFEQYFGKLVPSNDNKFAALNSAVWSGGTFIYVPKNVILTKPLQSYFRMNAVQSGQFERTLIIVDEGAEVEYIEGCTAPIYKEDMLHCAVVEIFVAKNAKCRYTTVQNWSKNVLNLVTKRAICEENATMEWIDGNIGSKITMKYPSVILKGDYSKASTISIAHADQDQIQDAGCKMIHLGKHTSSTIIAKSFAKNNGKVNYRGLVKHAPSALFCKSNIECDTLLFDSVSSSDTIPYNIIQNGTSVVQHEAKVSKVSEQQLFYLMSRGLTEIQATDLIIAGFMEPFTKELPLEYAIELNQLLSLEMEGSLG
jgi:Fe-S cluster assembly protein SufB